MNYARLLPGIVALALPFGGFVAPVANACCNADPSPPPTPTEQQFLADMKNIGVRARNWEGADADRQILSNGYSLCFWHWNGGGIPPQAMTGLIESMEYRNFNDIMAISVRRLCPTDLYVGSR